MQQDGSRHTGARLELSDEAVGVVDVLGSLDLRKHDPVDRVADLGDDLGIALLPFVVNACWPERAGLDKSPAMAARSHKLKLTDSVKTSLESAAVFGRSRLAQQREQLERLRSERNEEVVTLPRLATPRLGPAHLVELADALIAGPEGVSQ